MNINTYEVLEAAGTKWNFLKFQPGLVGGHCIGVDPYYLTHKAQMLDYHAQVILAGRSINDGMANYIAEYVRDFLFKNKITNGKILVMGATFKENVSDIRNSKVAGIIQTLKRYPVEVHVTDPHADSDALKHEYGFELTKNPDKDYDVVIVAVPHEKFLHLGDNEFAEMTKPHGLIADIKGMYRGKIKSRKYWSL